MMRRLACVGAALGSVALAATALAQAQAQGLPELLAPRAVTADPPLDRANPASMVALRLPTAGTAINAVLYTAAGAGPHPALLLLHGFPGNEQNLDLAQAARRAGWSVLTLHYRGSWGSPGAFSYAHCAEDAANAARWLRDPAVAARYAIDPARVAVAGHSMGGMMAARIAADVPGLLGAFLIDPWDIAATGRSFAVPAALAGFKAGELDGDMPPLAGTSEDALIGEIRHAGPRFDLAATVRTLADRPLALVFASRGLGSEEPGIEAAARIGRTAPLSAATWPTDHSFSDARITLAAALVGWLTALTPPAALHPPPR